MPTRDQAVQLNLLNGASVVLNEEGTLAPIGSLELNGGRLVVTENASLLQISNYMSGENTYILYRGMFFFFLPPFLND
jgi:hypothetical protein